MATPQLRQFGDEQRLPRKAVDGAVRLFA